jgi:hypothetical protein
MSQTLPRLCAPPRRSAAVAAVVFAAAAGLPAAALADATGSSFANSATISLTPLGGGTVAFSTDPSFRRAHATAYADHSDTPDAAFNENVSITSATASASQPNMARVTNAAASLGSLSLGVGEAFSFAHRVAPSFARADGFAELEILFQVNFTGSPPPMFNLLLGATGSASLSGSSLPDETWSANYQFYLELYDFTSPGSPTLFSTSRSDQLNGPGSASVTDPIAVTQTIMGLQPNHSYGLYAYFDSESSAAAPAPGTLAVWSIAIALGSRRRRR